MLNSLWELSAKLPEFDGLKKDAKTDVLIIGGGLAGILCAYTLHSCGINYMLVEADKICKGITKNTTAKITSQHGLIYSKISKEFGTDIARKYLICNEIALNQYKKLCSDIDCDFEIKDSFVYTVKNLDMLSDEFNVLKKINCNAEAVDRLKLPFSVKGAIRFRNQAQFNPVKFLSKIAEKLNIYENTKAAEYDGKSIITDKGLKVTAEKIIVTTHFPFINKHGSYFLKMYQHRSYVIALEKAQLPNGMYVDEDLNGLSLRSYKNFVLLGGGSHRTGKDGGGWTELIKIAGKYYPESKISARWATQDCMTLDGIPYIGQYSKNTPNVFVATGFNKWGFTSAMIAANLLKDMICNKENSYADVFSPSRTILRKQLFINAAETTANLLKITKPRCPHLGCALQWNMQEMSWDCPCHGSRFTKSGKLIDNPATDGIKNIND